MSWSPPAKRFCLDPAQGVFPCEEDEESDFLFYMSAHLDPDVVIWSDCDEKKVAANLMIGWELDDIAAREKSEVPQETMFLIQNMKADSGTDPSVWKKEIERARSFIKDSTSILLVVGAGMGCDSQLPDYRSATGFWKQYPPLTKAGISLQDMSKSDWFIENPELAWGFYSHRQYLYSKAVPHSGFKYILDVMNKKDGYVMTSNVDSQFQKAGFPEEKIFETHGSLAYQQCIDCCEGSDVWKDANVEAGKPLKVDPDSFCVIDAKDLPICPYCKQKARPNVSFFTDTEFSFNDKRQLAQKQQLLTWLQTKKNDISERLLVIEIGCGTSIHSLRFESEVLLYHTKEIENRVNFIRLNPTHYAVESKKNLVGIGMCAREGLGAICSE